MEQVKECLCRARFEHAKELFENTHRGAFDDLPFAPQKRLECGAIDIEIESCAKFNQANHPNRVLDKADIWLANCTEHSFCHVGIAADIVDDRLVFDVVEKAVDGKIPAKNVLFFSSPDVVADDEVGNPCVSGPKRRDFNDFLAKANMSQSKPSSN